MSQPTIAQFFKPKKDDKKPVPKAEEEAQPPTPSKEGKKNDKPAAPIELTNCEQT